MVKPTIAVVSVGLHNRYHHPGEETLARLKDAGATVYRTDRDGQLTLTSTGHGVVVAAAKAAEGGAGLIEVAALPTPAPPPADAPPADAPPADAPPAVATAARACAYEASRNSEVFHEASCGNVGRIAAQNRVCFVTREEAAAAGLRPAKCCDP
jgi:competence protein ComEC